MVEVARRRARELGLTNVDFAVIDAQELDLEPGSFDAALCRWGYMLMANPDEAIRRTRTVLPEGGTLALATWDGPDQNLWMAAPVMALVGHGAIPPPNPSDPSPFAMNDPEALEARLRAAGFASARTDRVEFVQRYPSFDEYWAETLDMSAPVTATLAGLTAADAESVRGATRDTLSRFTRADGRIEVPANAWVAVAVA
jgi:SAM-dependent methyltransferase